MRHLICIKLVFLFQSASMTNLHMKSLGMTIEETAIVNAVIPVLFILTPPLAGFLEPRTTCTFQLTCDRIRPDDCFNPVSRVPSQDYNVQLNNLQVTMKKEHNAINCGSKAEIGQVVSNVETSVLSCDKKGHFRPQTCKRFFSGKFKVYLVSPPPPTLVGTIFLYREFF